MVIRVSLERVEYLLPLPLAMYWGCSDAPCFADHAGRRGSAEGAQDAVQAVVLVAVVAAQVVVVAPVVPVALAAPVVSVVSVRTLHVVLPSLLVPFDALA